MEMIFHFMAVLTCVEEIAFSFTRRSDAQRINEKCIVGTIQYNACGQIKSEEGMQCHWQVLKYHVAVSKSPMHGTTKMRQHRKTVRSAVRALGNENN